MGTRWRGVLWKLQRGELYKVWERTAGCTVQKKKKTQRGLIAEEDVREAGEKRMMMIWGGT